MLEQGVGQQAWRDRYPEDEWLISDRRQLANGDRILIAKKLFEDRAAVLTFYDWEHELHWVIHCDGKPEICVRMFELLVEEAERHPIPTDYSGLPNFGRF